jgi:alanine racemase
MAFDLPPAALRLDIDRDALAANWRALDAMSGAARTGAAVKADAYGIGASVAVPVLRDAGCRDFFVTYAHEASEIAGMVPTQEISLLHGPINDGVAVWARATGVRVVINSLEQAARWLAAGGGRCDLMVDTGINRLGLPLSELGDPLIGRLDVDVLMSHLASADEDVALNAKQRTQWEEARSSVAHERASLANSAGIALGAPYHGDLTRPGLSLYGGIPRAEMEGRIAQVAFPMAAVMQVRQIAAGEGVGYNSTFIAPAPMRVGVVALGYADGFLRCWSGGKGVLLWQGHRLPVLGRVSMDMVDVDLAGADDLREGDWLQVEYALPQASAVSGLSQYELLTLLGDRFAR